MIFNEHDILLLLHHPWKLLIPLINMYGLNKWKRKLNIQSGYWDSCIVYKLQFYIWICNISIYSVNQLVNFVLNKLVCLTSVWSIVAVLKWKVRWPIWRVLLQAFQEGYLYESILISQNLPDELNKSENSVQWIVNFLFGICVVR